MIFLWNNDISSIALSTKNILYLEFPRFKIFSLTPFIKATTVRNIDWRWKKNQLTLNKFCLRRANEQSWEIPKQISFSLASYNPTIDQEFSRIIRGERLLTGRGEKYATCKVIGDGEIRRGVSS